MARKRAIAVSDLAEVATCQRKVYLRAKLGERTTAEREKRREEGTRLHQLAYEQSHQSARKRDGRCFIATAVFGESAPETDFLRWYRDEKLVRMRGGRTAVECYYKLSPAVAKVLDRCPRGRTATAWILRRTIEVLR